MNMPDLATERLILRPMRESDADDMYSYASRNDVTEYLLWSPHPSRGYTRDYLRYISSRYKLGDFYDWAVIEKTSGKMIGTCGFTRFDPPHNGAEIGYVLGPDYHGRGYATEAAERVVEYGFSELGLHRIEARFMMGNEASLKVMEKLGMTFEGYKRDGMLVKGKYRTIGVCSIIENEWKERKMIETCMKKYPLKLDCVSKSAIWGGNRLRNNWNKHGEGENIAETWELTVREKENSKITNGCYAGATLSDYIEKCVGAVSSDYKAGERFPLLVKFIDAAESLSVQVHPDDEYAKTVENDSGKTEMWYIVDATKDAEIIFGLADGVDKAEFSKAVDNGGLDRVMKRVKVKKGDSFFIPAGMLHAIGRGILIAEIQQNSDLTYRVYDYDRVGADGKKRELHTDKAKDVVRPFTDCESESIRYSRGKTENCLAASKYFKVDKLDLSAGKSTELTVDKCFVSLLCVDGEGAIEYNGEEYPIKVGDSYFLPAGMGKCEICGNVTILCSTI